MKDKSPPIAIFDSGMGGLTVLKAVRKKLPEENLIYFGDTAHLPYGTKSKKTVLNYAYKAAQFLTEKKIKLMIIACNTASVFALRELKKSMPFKVMGVIDPGVKAAAASKGSSIGVIGTYGTVKSGIYQRKIRSIMPDSRVKAKACPLFVPLAEEGWFDSRVTRQVAEIYLKEFCPGLDTLILGCTHYPLLKKVISGVAGSKVNIIDSAEEVAAEAGRVIKQEQRASGGDRGTLKFYVSDSPELFRKSAPVFLAGEINLNKVTISGTAD